MRNGLFLKTNSGRLSISIVNRNIIPIPALRKSF